MNLELSNTVSGMVCLTSILKLVGDGVLPHANAIKLVVQEWGYSEEDAGGIINGIITPRDR